MSKIENETYLLAKYKFENEKISITKLAQEFNINRKTLSRMLKEDGVYNGKGYTDKQLKYAIEQLQLGKSITSICRDLNVARYNFTNFLNTNNVYISNNDYDDDKYKDLINDYTNGASKDYLLTKYKISESKLYFIIKKYNATKSNRKYYLNENFFEIIDTEEKAYWLGFLYADGYNNEDYIELNLQAKDYNHLIKFKKSTNYSGDIKYKKDSNSYRIILCSKKLCEDLSKLGCIKNKSLKIEFPYIKKDLLNHFIRGYIDGDGLVSNYLDKNNKITQSRINIVGTKPFLTTCDLIFNKYCCTNIRNKFKKEGNAYSITYNGNRQCIKILNWIYQDANIYLDRKYDKYNELIAVLSQLPQKG